MTMAGRRVGVAAVNLQFHFSNYQFLPINSSPAEMKDPNPAEVPQLLDHLFRHESGKMVATLTRIFGIENLTLAEDVVQEALARALQSWPFYGVPENPAAWIMRTSRNLALDVVRRQKVFKDKEPEITRLIEPSFDQPISENEISDDRLRLIFVCCHPVIPPEAQVALALKTLCGFSTTEISCAFITTEAAIAKRLTRAKQKIREAGLRFEIPAGEELAARIETVLQSLYLLFNEGYKASTGDKLVREDVCFEAIRLTSLLVQHPAGDLPKTHALLALMLLNAARLPGRVDDQGNLLRIQDQDRARWDKSMIALGMFHLSRAAAGHEVTEYHLQAAIASCHTVADRFESTDWPRILSLYDRLGEIDPSPVVLLNRAVAVAEVRGPQAGIDAIQAIPGRDSLAAYYLLHAVLGDLEFRLNHHEAAARHFKVALSLAPLESERTFLAKRLESCERPALKP
jgi:RNA polymerase sigma-70 factor (ECF subfamily)